MFFVNLSGPVALDAYSELPDVFNVALHEWNQVNEPKLESIFKPDLDRVEI